MADKSNKSLQFAPHDLDLPAHQEYLIDLMKKGQEAWNYWRVKNQNIELNFDNVDFSESGRAFFNFSSFHFGNNISFSKAIFGNDTTFINTIFGNDIKFSNATFGNNIIFEDAVFGNNILFDRVSFGDEIIFIKTTFGDEIIFNGSTFGNATYFVEAKFGNNVFFGNVVFGSYVDFSVANFSGYTNLSYITIGNVIDIRAARFGDSTKMNGVSFANKWLRFDSLENVDLRGCDFRDVDTAGKTLDGADLRGVKNLCLDDTSIRNTRFSSNAPDHWSVLRRTYTGPRLAFTLLLLIAFFAPYGTKIGYWSMVNQYQEYTISEPKKPAKPTPIALTTTKNSGTLVDTSETEARSAPVYQTTCRAEKCRNLSVWQLAIGVDRGKSVYMLAVLLILFNVLKGIITFFVLPMREQEERCGYSPERLITRSDPLADIAKTSGGLLDAIKRIIGSNVNWGYELFYKAHMLVLALFLFSTVAFITNAVTWLTEPVSIPVVLTPK